MAVTVTDLRTIVNEADATTGWTSTNSLGAANTSPTPIESTNRLEIQVSNATEDSYVTVSSVNLTAQVLYAWFSHRAEFDTLANVGVGLQIGDGTNRVAYGIIGSDAVAFAHFEGPVVWQNLVLDVANTGSYSSVTIAGSAPSLNRAAITQIGFRYKTIVKSVGGAVNCFIDIIRRLDTTANNGCALSITGGTSGDPGTFEEIATADRATGNQQAHGIVRKLGAGLYGVQGPLRFGNATGSSSSWFEVKNISVAFEDRKLSTNVYKIVIVDNGTGTTTFRVGTKVGSGATATGADGCNFIIPTGVGGSFDASTDTDVTDVFMYGSNFRGWEGGMSFRTGQEVIGDVIAQSGTVTAGGATFVNTQILQSTATTDSSSLSWNVATDPDGYLDGMTFSTGSNAHHAIEFGTLSPATMSLNNISFGTGFNSSNSQNDSTLYIRRTTATVTINLIGCTGNISYKSSGATVNLVINPVTTEVTVRDENSALLSGARVYLEASDGAGDLPYQDSVGITRSGAVATVSHTSHGLSTGQKIKIKGADQSEYNGSKTITFIDTNSYSFTVSGSPTTPATGTIVATGIVIDSTTTGTGVVSDTRTFSTDQNIVGKVRKSSVSPLYKENPLSATISSTNGVSLSVKMVRDD